MQKTLELRQWLLQSYAASNEPDAGIFLQTLERVHFFVEADALRLGERADCRAILRLCAPYLETLCQEPEEGWLAFFYAELAHGMFHDERRRAAAKNQLRAMRFYLAVLRFFLRGERCEFDPLTDIDGATDDEVAASRIAGQYRRFEQAVQDAYYVELMRIGRQIMPFDPASHTIGVHHLAMHMGRQASRAGIPMDLAMVSAASLSHDIGKFGCYGNDAKRIPYLHYYFTWQWLASQQMEAIANIAANHSTWDLEFENLPVESLLLIYADFRVRGVRGDDGKEHVRICTLDEAYDMIFSKLSDMTEEKQLRYRTVYTKLHDFEQYLLSNGVSTDPIRSGSCKPSQTKAALLSRDDAPAELCSQTFANNIRLMRAIGTNASFELLLEQARNEKTLQSIRTYLHLYSEYHPYLSRRQKQMLLNFLYELLMHHDGDVRRRAGRIMGQILANSGPRYRKQLPEGVSDQSSAPTLLAFFQEAVQLWQRYVENCLHPDLRITPKHAQRISNSLKTIAKHLFDNLPAEQWPGYLEVLLQQLPSSSDEDRFVLLDTLLHLPQQALRAEAERIVALIGTSDGQAPIHLRIATLRLLGRLAPYADDALREKIITSADAIAANGSHSVAFEKRRVAGRDLPELSDTDRQYLYLSNTETRVHWMVKLSHIHMLTESAMRNPAQTFHTAMHLSNLLCVSEHLPVREYAGDCLCRITAALPAEQKNELIINLVRELESGRDEVSRFIPAYLGPMVCRLPRKEFMEVLHSLEALVRSENTRAAVASLFTLGHIIKHIDKRDLDVVEHIWGLLMTGIAHYDDLIHQSALSTLCRNIFSAEQIELPVRQRYFARICKKLLVLLEEPHPGELNFFTRAAALNHLYRFTVQARVTLAPQPCAPERPVAFFPGTFDPFSAGHQAIVQQIRALNFDVYLAIDEFSWSKQTLPKLLRRQIASISTADQLDVYLFPDDIPVNIAVEEDLQRLKTLLPSREVYLATGSDVVRNASAYSDDVPGGAKNFDHIVFYREELEKNEDVRTPIQDKIKGKLHLLTLPTFYENVSSSRIREYVDKNLDISMLVDPIVQNFIYEKGLYLRTPQQKLILAQQDLCLHFERGIQNGIPNQPPRADACSVTLRSRSRNTLHGWICGHTAVTTQLLDALGDAKLAAYVRKRVSGNILILDKIWVSHDSAYHTRLLCNELLARAQEFGHTYTLWRDTGEGHVRQALQELGMIATEAYPQIWFVDMRSPIVLIQDLLQKLKTPHRDDPEILRVVLQARKNLRLALTRMFPGSLLLTFDAELLNQALMTRIERCNGVEGIAPEKKQLGPYMCVPFGKILADDIVPNTVTKRLEVEKEFTSERDSFVIKEYPGYSTLVNQIRTVKSFRRPVLLVDDLLHNSYRFERLNPLLQQERVEVIRLIFGIMSAKGRDQMQVQHREAECEYFVPNLRYWQTESLLYPFLGGDSVRAPRQTEMLPSVNLILPYSYPNYFTDVSDSQIVALSDTALQNAYEILRTLERRHLAEFGKSLTLRRLSEALVQPRLPDRGLQLFYNLDLPASVYLKADQALLRRIRRREGKA